MLETTRDMMMGKAQEISTVINTNNHYHQHYGHVPIASTVRTIHLAIETWNHVTIVINPTTEHYINRTFFYMHFTHKSYS